MFYFFGNLAYFIIIGLLAMVAYYLAYQKAKKQTKYYRPFLLTAGAFACIALIAQVVQSLIGILPYFSGLRLLVTITANVAFLAFMFSKLEARFPFHWLRYFFHIGVALTVIVSITYDIPTVSDFLPTTASVFCFELIGISGVWIIAFVASFLTRTPLPQTHHCSTVRPDKIASYREAGLSEQEIIFFREQMATAKEQILTIEREFNRTAKLKAIETRHNTVKVAQNFFKELVQEPTRLSGANHFLYKLLPSLEDLLKKYNEINGHVAKNKQTYLILEKSGAIIERVCQEINDVYVQFHQTDYDEMLDEIQLASRNLKQTDNTSKSGDNVNDLINDAFN